MVDFEPCARFLSAITARNASAFAKSASLAADPSRQRSPIGRARGASEHHKRPGCLPVLHTAERSRSCVAGNELVAKQFPQELSAPVPDASALLIHKLQQRPPTRPCFLVSEKRIGGVPSPNRVVNRFLRNLRPSPHSGTDSPARPRHQSCF
jgi:hypothetical protein